MSSESHEQQKGVRGSPLGSDAAIARRWSLALWAVVGILLVVMAVPALAEAIQPLDDWVWEFVVSTELAALVAAAKTLDIIGGVLVMTSVVVVVAVILAWKRHRAALATWLLAMTAAQALSVLIKELYARPRPPLPLIDESDSWSFPSGHALTAAAVAITLVLLWEPAGGRRRSLLIVAAAYAFVMAASRVYLRAHWFTDVAEGLALGAATALAAALIVTWWTRRAHD